MLKAVSRQERKFLPFWVRIQSSKVLQEEPMFHFLGISRMPPATETGLGWMHREVGNGLFVGARGLWRGQGLGFRDRASCFNVRGAGLCRNLKTNLALGGVGPARASGFGEWRVMLIFVGNLCIHI